MVGWHYHVIAGVAGQQLAFQGFVGVEDVLHRLDARLFFEIRQRGGPDIVGPVVEMHRRRRLDAACQRQARSSHQGLAEYRNGQVGGPHNQCLGSDNAAAHAKPARNLPSQLRCRNHQLPFTGSGPGNPGPEVPHRAYLPDLILVQLRVITRWADASGAAIAYSCFFTSAGG
ncbi:hypothetical protein D3C79_813260 [compost metagenome]